MIPLLASLVFAQAPSRPPTAGDLVSRMFARYYGARSLSGSIRTTQVAGDASVVTETSLVYERPSRIRLAQRQRSSQIDRSGFLVSDGDRFAYTPPSRVQGASPFLMEPVKPEGRAAQSLGDLYAVVAADLPDRSPVLDALVARTDDLKYFKNQLATWNLAGKETIDGKTANVVEGEWRESEAQRPSGRYRLSLSDDGDLLRYVLTQKFAPPASNSDLKNPIASDTQVTVVTTWNVTIELNAPVKPNAFVLRAP